MMPSYIPISDDYGKPGNTVCQVSKEWIQNWIEFRPKIIVFCDFVFLKGQIKQKAVWRPRRDLDSH